MHIYNVDLFWSGIEAESPEEAVRTFWRNIDTFTTVLVTDDETGEDLGLFTLPVEEE